MKYQNASLQLTTTSSGAHGADFMFEIGAPKTGDAVRATMALQGVTESAPWPLVQAPLLPQGRVMPGAVDIDDLAAAFASTAEGARALEDGRKWVAEKYAVAS